MMDFALREISKAARHLCGARVLAVAFAVALAAPALACGPSAGAECQNDDDCDENERCLVEHCEPEPPDDGGCGGCPRGEICRSGACEPAPCGEGEEDECPSGYICDPELGLCLDESGEDECDPTGSGDECQSGEVCEAGQCVEEPERTLLAVTDLTGEASGESLALEVGVENRGNNDTTSVGVHAYAHRDQAPGFGELGDEAEILAELSAGATDTVSVELGDLEEGDHAAWVQLDPHGHIHDGDRDDVVEGPVSYQIAGGPNLSVTAFEVEPDSAGALAFEATVENLGGAVAEDFEVRFYASGQSPPEIGEPSDATAHIDSLAAGNAREAQATATGLPEGADQAWVIADGGRDLSDADRELNVAGPRRYAVGAPHLGLSDFEVSGESGEAHWSVEVHNFGSEPTDYEVVDAPQTDQLQVDFYEHETLAPDVPPDGEDCGAGLDSGDDFADLAHLSPGASATASGEHEVASPVGTHHGWVQVDRPACTHDPDRSNNLRGPVSYQP